MLFQPLKSGQKINRAFFNDLISFCNSLVLRGDGKTTQVTHTAGGTTVSAVIPEGQRGISAAVKPFVVTVADGVCSVTKGTVRRTVFDLLGGTTTRENLDVVGAATFDAPTVNTTCELWLILVATGWRYAWLGDLPGNATPPGVVGFPIARYYQGAIERRCPDYPSVMDIKHPFQVYFKISDFASGSFWQDGWESAPWAGIFCRRGYVCKPTVYSAGDTLYNAGAWTTTVETEFSLAEADGKTLYLTCTPSGGMSLAWSSSGEFAWDGDALVTHTPVAHCDNLRVEQYLTSVAFPPALVYQT